MRALGTVSVALIRAFLRGAARMGFAEDEVVAAAGIDPRRLADPDARVPREQAMRLWEIGASITGDASFGLHVAELAHAAALALGPLDVIDYATRTSATLGDALERLCRYSRILQEELLDIRLALSGEQARLCARIIGLPPGSLRHSIEFVMATFLLRGRLLAGREWCPEAVHFQHPAPPDPGEHQRIFGAAPRFAQPENEIVFDRALLGWPAVSADPRLCALLERQAEAILERLPPAELFTERVRRLLCDELHGGAVGSLAIARKLGTSRSTLQRRLREEGQTFRAILDSIRLELSRHYLQEDRLAISQIAFCLGFSETSAFDRAFKRWTRQSPVAFRAARRAQDQAARDR